MDSGIAITFLVYPVALLKQQAHRIVINYNTEEVVHTRRSAGLAINLTGTQLNPELPAVDVKRVIKPEPEPPIPIKPIEPAKPSASETRLQGTCRSCLARGLQESKVV